MRAALAIPVALFLCACSILNEGGDYSFRRDGGETVDAPGSDAPGSDAPGSDAPSSDGDVPCPPPMEECDGDPDTVCETDTSSDPAHCGGCATLCAGTCAVGTCSAGGFTFVAAGEGFTCARTLERAVACWGDNGAGQLGRGDRDPHSDVAAIGSLMLPGVGTGVIQPIAAGFSHACAIDEVGDLLCWGDNTAGQLGTGTVGGSSVPMSVAGTAMSWTHVAAGGLTSGTAFTCGVAEGTVWCWGSDGSGQLGNGGPVMNATSPMPIITSFPGGTRFLELALGQQHACVLAELSGPGRQVWCWGANVAGQIGNGMMAISRSSPDQVMLLTDATSISAGAAHTCATRATGSVACWGANSRYQLGTGSTSGSNLPTSVMVIDDARSTPGSIALASNTSYAAGGDELWAWGANDYDQISSGVGGLERATPLAVVLPGIPDQIAAGARHVCALVGSSLHCWGDNALGQVDPSSPGDTTVPDPRLVDPP